MTLQSTALARVAVGLMQGIALYLLQQALESKAWPATDGLIFAPLADRLLASGPARAELRQSKETAGV